MDRVKNNVFSIILQKIGTVPSAFITGPLKSDDEKKLLQLQWNIVFCIDGEDDTLLNQAKARISCIKYAEDFRQENNPENLVVSSKEKYPLVFFAPAPTEDSPIKLKITKKLALRKSIQGILGASGLVFIQNIPDEYYEYLYEITSEFPRWNDIYIFDNRAGDVDNAFVDLWKKERRALVSADPLQKYWDDDLTVSHAEGSESVLVYGNSYSVPANALDNIRHFGQLLTQESVGDIPYISKADEPTFFQSFLEKSTEGFPCWYWYSENMGFYVRRNIESQVIETTRAALESAKSKERKDKPILLQGRSFSGKTNILCSVAYRFFREGKYPVIYMPNMGATANLRSIRDGLDFLLRTLEKVVGEKTPVLLVWDTACKQPSDYEEIANLRTDLRWDGWQVELLCSGYNTGCYNDINQTVRQSFNPVSINSRLDENEIADFRSILLREKAFSAYEFDKFMRELAQKGDSEFLAYLYRFRQIRSMLRRHVVDEAETDIDSLKKAYNKCLAEALKHQYVDTLASFADELKKLDDFAKRNFPEYGGESEGGDNGDARVVAVDIALRKTLRVVALCTIYSCPVSNELFVRILANSENLKIPTWQLYQLCTRNNILREISSEPVSYQFRSALDAKLFLPGDNESGDNTQFRIVMDLINAVENTKEVDLLIILLKESGPNRHGVMEDKTIWEKHMDEYPALWKTLAERRKTNPCFEKILPLEKSLIREWYRKKWETLSDEEKTAALNELMSAKKELHDKYFELKKRKDDRSYDYRSKVLVEYVNIVLFISEKFSDEVDLKSHFELLQYDFLEYYNQGGKGNSYIPANYLKLGCRYYDRLAEVDCEKRQELLSELLLFAETSSVDSNDSYLSNEIASVESRVDKFHKNDDFLKKSIENGKPAAITIRVVQELRDLKRRGQAAFRSECIRNLLDTYLENPEYKDLVDSDPGCLYKLITLKWENITGRSSILPRDGEERIKIGLPRSDWDFFRSKCEHYSRLCGANQFPCAFAIDYLYVLASVHLGRYSENETVLLDPNNKSESGRRSLYLICDENGSPVLFSGVCTYYPESRYGEVNVVNPENMKFKKVRFYRAWSVGLTNDNCRRMNIPTGKDFRIALSRTGLKVDEE